MANLSTYAQEKFLNLLRGTAWTPPTNLWVALFNGDPTDAGTGGTDVTTTIRTAGRVQAPFGAPATAGGASAMTNSAIVDFGAAAGGATVTHFAIYDAQTGGNLIGYGTTSIGAVATGNTVSAAVGDISISIS